MIFTLKSFRDLGRCSYGTLKETFDTEKDVIYDFNTKVEITCVEDLFPYLWQAPGISGHTPKGSYAYFNGANTHWHEDFDGSIRRCDVDVKKLEKKIDKTRNENQIAKYKAEIDDLLKHKARLIEIVNDSDAEMEELKQQLVEENCGKPS